VAAVLATPLPWHWRAVGRRLCVPAFRPVCPRGGLYPPVAERGAPAGV